MVLTRNKISISTIMSLYILYLFKSTRSIRCTYISIKTRYFHRNLDTICLAVMLRCSRQLLFTVVNVNFIFFICEIPFLLASFVILRTRYRYISLHQTIAWFLLTNLICYNAITITNAPVDRKISDIIGIIDDLCIFS